MTPHGLAADLAAVAHDLRAAEAVERSAWTRYVNQGDEHRPAWEVANRRVVDLRRLRSLLLDQASGGAGVTATAITLAVVYATVAATYMVLTKRRHWRT